MTSIEAIEFLRERLKLWDREFKNDVPDYGEVLKKSIEALRFRERYKWILVEERLPRLFEKYLTCDEHGCIRTLIWLPFDRVFCDENSAECIVLAWMPLPAPYRP